MKKSIIAAGAASVALAAMPIVGAFAATTYYGTPIEDTLTVSLSEVCTLSRQSSAHPTASGAPSGAQWGDTASATNDDDTFTATITAGTDYANIAQSAFDVTCNAADDGYQVTVGTTNFDDTTWQYNAAGKVSGSSTWNLTSSAKSSVAIDNGDKVWESPVGTPVSTGSFTITYNVYPDINQGTGNYTATATYVLGNLGA